MTSRGRYKNEEVAARVTSNLIRLREGAGFDQADLEARAGLEAGALVRLEEGREELTYEDQTRLAGALNVDVGEFFDGVSWTPPVTGGQGFEVRDG
jgi:transcriptional regulator with XRE-family HTH domain